MNTMKWLMKREFWENRGGFFWAPVIAGIVFVVLNIGALVAALAAAGRNHIQVGLIRFDQLVQRLDDPQRELIGGSIDMSLYMVVGMFSIVAAFVMFFYCLAALYDERRDRSVLFWKSLPISDRDTVVSKVLSALLVVPAIATIAGLVTGLVLLLVIAIFFAFHGQNVFGVIASTFNPIEVLATTLALIPLWAVWALPTVGWLMLVSAWARSKPLLWAFAIPVGSGLMVTWFDLMQSFSLPDSWFWEHLVGRALFSVAPLGVFGSGLQAKIEAIESAGPQDMVGLFGISDVFTAFAQADLWIGAAIGIVLLVIATRLRRWRDEG
jgi:ABC-2 type transport system permease protein